MFILAHPPTKYSILQKTIFETETKSSNEDESYFRKSGKTLFKRKHVIGKEEVWSVD